MACQDGDESFVCLATDSPDGECPIKGRMPELSESNTNVVEIFYQAQGSAEKIEGKDKPYVFLKPTEIEALMRLLGIEESERQEMLVRLFLLEEMANRKRPGRPVSTVHSRRRRR